MAREYPYDKHQPPAALLESTGDGLASALEHVTKLTTEANELHHKPHFFQIDGVKKKRFFAFNGQITETEIDRPPRQHVAHDLDSFVKLVRDLAVAGVTVWHAGDLVRAVLNSNDWRDETISIGLAATAARKAIAALGQQCWEQAPLIALLKTQLAGTGLDDALLLQLRSVNFTKHEQAVGEVTPRQHSFGSAVDRRVSGIGEDFPDEVLVRFAWWNVGAQVLSPHAPRPLADSGPQPNSALLDTVVAVRVAIEIDFTKKAFWLRPLEDDLERARQYAQRVLHEWLISELEELEDAETHVYHGVI